MQSETHIVYIASLFGKYHRNTRMKLASALLLCRQCSTINTTNANGSHLIRYINLFMRLGSKKPTTLAVGGIEPRSFFV